MRGISTGTRQNRLCPAGQQPVRAPPVESVPIRTPTVPVADRRVFYAVVSTVEFFFSFLLTLSILPDNVRVRGENRLEMNRFLPRSPDDRRQRLLLRYGGGGCVPAAAWFRASKRRRPTLRRWASTGSWVRPLETNKTIVDKLLYIARINSNIRLRRSLRERGD